MGGTCVEIRDGGVSRHQIVKIFVTVSRNLQFINEGNGEYLSADYLGAVSRNPRPICLSRKGDFGST